MKTTKLLLLSIFTIAASMFGAFVAPATPVDAKCGDERFLTLPAWYRGLTSGVIPNNSDKECTISVEAAGGDIGDFVQILALNIVEILMQVVAYVCVAFVIVGGFKYLTSTGSPDANSKGRQTIQNALIGLVVSIVAIGIVNFVVNMGA